MDKILFFKCLVVVLILPLNLAAQQELSWELSPEVDTGQANQAQGWELSPTAEQEINQPPVERTWELGPGVAAVDTGVAMPVPGEPVAPGAVPTPMTKPPTMTTPPTMPATPPPTPQPTPPPPTEQPTPKPQGTNPPPDDIIIPKKMEEPDKYDTETSYGFSQLTFSPQLSYAYYPKATYTYEGISLNVDPRNSFVGKMHFDIGGDGPSFEFAPLVGFESTGNVFSSMNLAEGMDTSLGGRFVPLGLQFGIAYRFTAGAFYPHLGLGFHGTYLFSTALDYGAELYGRVPLGFTWYVAKHWALFFEAAFMYGVTGMKLKEPGNMDDVYADYGIEPGQEPDESWTQEQWDEFQQENQITEDDLEKMAKEQIAQTFKFGKSWGLEFSVGFRFP